MNPTKAILPFRDDAEYLEAEHQNLVAKAARLSLQRRLKQDTSPGAIAVHRQWPVDDGYIAAVRQRLVEAEVVERGLRDQIDERLAVHRGTEGVAVLDLDALCEEHGLTDDERIIIIVATIVSCGSQYAEAITDALSGSHHYSLTIDDLIRLLDPHDLGGWAKARLLFHREAPLLVHGLIEVETHPKVPTTTDLLDCRVSITHRAFATITGVEELAEVDWASAAPTPETTPAT